MVIVVVVVMVAQSETVIRDAFEMSQEKTAFEPGASQKIGPRVDLNHLPSVLETDALPSELQGRCSEMLEAAALKKSPYLPALNPSESERKPPK